MAITFCKVKSFEVVSFEKILKVEQFGIKTADFASAFGEDSRPLAGMTALYCDTSNDGEKVIFGYINKNQLSKVKAGEKRMFSLKPDGSQSIDIYLRNDGKMEVGGAADNLVSYTDLNTALENQKNLINTELQKIATAIGNLSGVYVPAPVEIDISLSKIESLLCP